MRGAGTARNEKRLTSILLIRRFADWWSSIVHKRTLIVRVARVDSVKQTVGNSKGFVPCSKYIGNLVVVQIGCHKENVNKHLAIALVVGVSFFQCIEEEKHFFLVDRYLCLSFYGDLVFKFLFFGCALADARGDYVSCLSGFEGG